jgi:hypothetical protein
MVVILQRIQYFYQIGFYPIPVRGRAIQLDGNTSFIHCRAAQALRLSADFSVSAWIAAAAWPPPVRSGRLISLCFP